MSKSKEIDNARKHVLAVLMRDEESRSSDSHLIIQCYKDMLLLQGISLGSLSFEEVVENRKQYGLPSMETITRSRRWCQSQYANIRANADVTAYREYNEEVFKEKARDLA